jgi:Gram-negative bacterial TonB protein C-terminal
MPPRLVLLLASASVGLAACAALMGGGGAPPSGQLKPTCADVEMDACIAESVTVSAQSLPGLESGDVAALLADRRPVPVRCILRESGAVEACHVLDSRGPPFDDSIEHYLQRRRYTPVTYRGKPVLVPYTFLVSFNPPPAELARTSGVRIEVFRALLFRLRGPAADAGAARPLVCVGIGDDVADPPKNEMDALIRAGAQVEPASSCWGLMQTVGGAAPFGSIVVRDVRFEQPDVAEVRAELGVSGQSPEFLLLRVSRLGGRWLVEQLPAPAADAGVRASTDAGTR